MRDLFGAAITLTLAAPTAAVAQTRATVAPAVAPASERGVPPPVLGRVVRWRGGAVPPGYVVDTAPRSGLLYGGLVTFLGAYAVMPVLAAERDRWALALPVVGPFVLAADLFDEAARHRATCFVCIPAPPLLTDFAGGLVILLGVAQAAGITMAAFAIARPHPILRYEPARASARWGVTPGVSGAPLGLTLSLTHL